LTSGTFSFRVAYPRIPSRRAHCRPVVGMTCIRPIAPADEPISSSKVDSWATSAASR